MGAAWKPMPTSAADGMTVTARFPVRRHPRWELKPVQTAFIDAAGACGLPCVADPNRPGAMGVGRCPQRAQRVRMSAALTYLAGARDRPTWRSAVADRVEVRGEAATGVRLADGEIVPPGRVVLVADAYASPAILQRSGIGPAT